MMVCIIRSLWPFDRGYSGLDVFSSIPHSVVKARNCRLANGMLSHTNVSGMPWRAYMDFICVMIVAEGDESFFFDFLDLSQGYIADC